MHADRPDHSASVAAALDATAEMVARRVRVWFDERDVWIREDLLIRAKQDAIDLDSWHGHERVAATGLTILVNGDGPRDVVYVLEPKGGDS